MAVTSSTGVTYHNPQIGSNHTESVDLTSEVGVCNLVAEAYQRGMDAKIRCGLQQRLRNAHQYAITDRIDRIAFSAPEKDGATNDDCENGCDELFSVNLDMMRLQYDTAMSTYMDTLKTRGNDYSTVDPTPIPDTSQESKERIRESAFQSILRDITIAVQQRARTPEEQDALYVTILEGLLGGSEGQERLQEVITRHRTIETSKLFAEAQKKAHNAKIFIDDKLTESNYDEVILHAASNAFWFDYAVVFAPFTEEVDTTEISQGKLVETIKKRWSMRTVNPINHFFSETTTYNDMGDFEGEVLWMSRNDVKQIESLDGGIKDNVLDVLDNFQHYHSTNDANTDDEYQDTIWSYHDRIPVTRIFIRLSDEQASELFDKKRLKKKKASHICEFMCVKDKLLFKKLYPRYKEYNPYRKNSFTVIDEKDLSSGRGLYSICRTAQEMIDNSMIGVFDNMKELNKYILEVNESKLKEPDELEDDLDAERPIIRTKGIGNYVSLGGNDRAVFVQNIPDNITSFTNTLVQGINMMERVGFSSFALGQGNFSNVRSTGQSAILQANSNKRFGRFLQKQEQWIETPIIDYIWTAEAIRGDEPGILVDSTISVKSYRGFLQKQNQADELGLFMQNLVGFMNARTQLEANGEDVAFFDALLKQYVDASGFDAEQLDIGPDVAGLLDAAGAPQVDPVQQPLANLDGRNNVPDDINQVI